MQELLSEAIKHGKEVHIEAIIVADERGRVRALTMRGAEERNIPDARRVA
jgi:hypothetical protein